MTDMSLLNCSLLGVRDS